MADLQNWHGAFSETQIRTTLEEDNMEGFHGYLRFWASFIRKKHDHILRFTPAQAFMSSVGPSAPYVIASTPLVVFASQSPFRRQIFVVVGVIIQNTRTTSPFLS